MEPTRIYRGLDARIRILMGIAELARAMSVTYGPHGRHVALDRPGGYILTKSGINIAYEFQPGDPLRRIGARSLLQACTRVRDMIGDGSTTTAILASKLLHGANKIVATGVDPGRISTYMKRAGRLLDKEICSYSRPVRSKKKLEQVAMIASNGDKEISEALADICMRVGKTGTISIEDGKGVGIEVEHRPGYLLDSGAEDPGLGPQKGKNRYLDVCLVALVPHRLETFDDVRSILEEGSQWPHPILIMSERCSGEALVTLVKNNKKVPCVSIRAASDPRDATENLRDMAALSGATMADPGAGHDWRKWNPEWFGSVQSAEIRSDSASLLSFENDDTEQRILDRVRSLTTIRDSTESDYDRDRLTERIAKLSGGFAVLKVGGVTELARKERRGRIESCLGSVQAALRSGVCPGAGIIYLRASEVLENLDVEMTKEEERVWMMMADSMLEPIRVLARNAGSSPDIVLERVYRDMDEHTDDPTWWGWDPKFDEVRDLGVEPLVVDPLDQVRVVIESAIFIASTLVAVEIAIVRQTMKTRK